MKPDFFWNNWAKPHKIAYQALMFIFLCSLLVYAITYASGSSFVISWDVETLIDPVKMNFDTYHIGIFEFPVNIENYVISKSFIATDLQVNAWPAYILLIWLSIFVSLMLSLITDLSRFWFVVSVVLLTLLFVGLKLDYLVLFNAYNKIGLLIAIALYFPSLYYFHFLRNDIGFSVRFFTHITSTVIFAVVIYYFSHVHLPFLHLANYGIFVPLALTAIFALMIGHEIVSGFLRVITSGMLTGESRSLIHFLVFSIVFMVNAVLVLLRNSGRIDLDMYLIGSFWLLTLGAVIGIWGYKLKEMTYSGMFPFYPFGAFLFIGLAITSHLTISYIFISGNDSLMEVIEDIVIYSQLGYSAMFVVYVIANFFDMMRHNVNVGKVLYKPQRMPYFISRFAGVIVIMGLFFKFNMAPYYQSVAGYYAGIGDLYLEADDHLSAAEYYKLSNIYSGTSHRANYALATLERRNGNTTEEIEYLKKAIGKHPTPFAYVNLSTKLLERKKYFESIFTLQDGLSLFTEDAYLLNNLGLSYLAMENPDSAFFYLNNAQYANSSLPEPTANIFALLSKQELSIREDTLDYLLQQVHDLSSLNNLVVLANNLKKGARDEGMLKFGDPKTENPEQLVYNYNKSINTPALVDSFYLEKMKVFYDSSNVSWFQDNLYFASALALYRQGDISTALKRLNLLAVQNPEKKYYSLLGKICMANKAFGLAIENFKNAFQNGQLEVAPEMAFAYMEDGDLERAAFIWKQIEFGGDSLDADMARKMIRVIEARNVSNLSLSDVQTIFPLLAYRYMDLGLDQLRELILNVDNEDVQAIGFLRLFDVYLDLGQHNKALEILQQLGQLTISKIEVVEEINLAQCQYAFHTGDQQMQQRLYSNMKSEHLLVNDYLQLFRAMETAESDGAEKVALEMEQLGYRNPFFEDGVLSVATFFNTKIQDQDRAYNILLNSVNLNPFSIPLNQAYALQCLRVGLNNYAMDTRQELRSMMPSAMFLTFEAEFQNLLEEIESKSADW